MSKNKDSIIVYWSMYGAMDHVDRISMMWEPPTALVPTIPSNKKSNLYISCSGMKNFFKNSFTVFHPADSKLKFRKENDLLIPEEVNGVPAWKFFDKMPLENMQRVSYDFSWIFFCEEDLTLELMPPFLHKTVDRSGGVVSAGSFNISKWFRPVNPDYLIWEDSKEISVKKGDPAFYLRFLTDKKVILKQFDFNQELYSVVDQILQHKNFFSREPLETLYNRFTRSNKHKKVLKLIKDNLLE